MKIRKISLLVFLSFLVISCATNLSPQPTQTETRPTATTRPISTSTQPPTATLEPPILESYSHVFAYADGENIIFLDEEAHQITKVVSGTGGIQDFKVSPDNNWVIYSSSSGANAVLDIQRMGQFKRSRFAIESENIIFFDWVSSTEFVVLTDKAYYLGSLDGSKKQIGTDINIVQSASSRSIYSAIKSPTDNNLLVLENIFIDEKQAGCNVYFLTHDNGILKELLKEENKCRFDDRVSWSPDGKFAGINYLEGTGNTFWYTTYIFDVTSGDLIHANEENTLYPYREIAWSPDGGYLSFVQNTFTVVIQTNNFYSGEVVLEQDFGIPPLQKLFWSPNGRYLMYGRAPNYMYIFDTLEKEYVKVPLYDIPSMNDYADFWWSSNSDGVFSISGENGKLGGIYWYSIDTKKVEKIGDLIKYPPKPYLPYVIVKQSKNSRFSTIYISSRNEDETTSFIYYLLDEENLQISPAITVNNPIYPPPFVWVK